MKMKKLTAVLAVFLMMFLAACGNPGGNSTDGTTDGNNQPDNTQQSSNGNNDEVNIDELRPEPGAKLVIWESKEERPFIEEAIKAFEEEYGVPVTFEEVAGGDQLGRLQTDGPAKLAADVLSLPHDQLGPAATAGLLLPNDVFEQQTRDNFMEVAVKASEYDGILYGYPKSVESYAMFYNKDILPEAPATWEDVKEFAREFNDTANRKYAIMWEFEPYYGYPFIGSWGGYVFGDNGTNPDDIGLNLDSVVEGFEYFRSLKEILPMNTGDVTNDVKSQLFRDGQLAMNIDGPWAVGVYRDEINIGVAPLPAFPNGSPAMSFSGVKLYAVNYYSDYPIAARLLANFLTSEEMMLKNYEMTGIIPANLAVGDSSLIKDDPITSGFFAQFENSVSMPGIPEMRAVWDPLKAAMAAVWNEDVDVKETLDQMVVTIKEKMLEDQG